MPNGLSKAEAGRRLKSVGPNAMPDTAMHPLRRAVGKLWAPVPWMLEAAIVLEIALGHSLEGAIIAGLLVFNAGRGLFQEGRAQATLAALKSRLALNASVRRDGTWATVPAAELVPGDVIKLSLGGVVAADAKLTEGEILLDQSMLTGESVPIEAGPGLQAFAVYAGVLPEDKYRLVKAFQKGGRTVGMCGDGANDAPALRQAQMGIAVSTATDVAKSAAGIVLTKAGLEGVVAAVKEGRTTFQRILTYTLNSVTKKIATVLLLAIGLLMTGHAVLTPLLMVILMITGDFLAMSLTTDNVRPSPQPNVWRIGNLTIAGTVMGACLLAFCTAALAIGQYALGLGIGQARTLTFIALVFGSQSMIYAIRERGRLWRSRPSVRLLASSAADILIAAALAIMGLAMTPLPPLVVGGTLLAAIALALILDLVKVPVFARCGIA